MGAEDAHPHRPAARGEGVAVAPPFLAVTLDAKRRIARAAKSLSLDVGPFGWGYLELLEHVWERKDPRVSALVLSACFGPDERVPAALAEFGFLTVVGEGAWELAKEEADRLLLTHKQRVAAGKARSEAAGRAAGGTFQRSTSESPAENQRTASGQPALTPSTQHPAPSNSPSENPRAADSPPPLRLEEQRPGRTRKPSRQQVLYSALVAHRAEVLGPEALPDESWSVQRQNEALGGPILECESGLLLAALQRFLESDFAGRCNPPGPLGVFVKQWSRWVSDVMRSNAAGGK